MKTLVTIIAISLATTLSLQAQTDKQMNPKTESVKEQPQEDFSKQAKTQTERMTRDLDLTAEQSARVMELNKNLYSDMSTMQSEKLKAEDRDGMKQRSVKKYESGLQSVLDDNQFKKYTTMKDKYMTNFDSNTSGKVPAQKSVQPSRDMNK